MSSLFVLRDRILPGLVSSNPNPKEYEFSIFVDYSEDCLWLGAWRFSTRKTAREKLLLTDVYPAKFKSAIANLLKELE